MSTPTVAELEAATNATAAAIESGDMADVYLAAEAEEALYAQVFTGPCDRRTRTRTGDRDMNFPTVADVIAAFFSASPQAGDPGVCVDSRDRLEAEPDPDEPVPFTLTGQAEAVLDAGPEPEPEAEL